MSSKIRKIVEQHLVDYSEPVKNGIFGNDNLHSYNQAVPSFSVIYSYLASQEMSYAAKITTELNNKVDNGEIEKDFGKLLDSLLYWWRGLFFIKLSMESIERDKLNITRQLPESFFVTVANEQKSLYEALNLLQNNSLYVFEAMFGSSWMESKKELVAAFGEYQKCWNELQTFNKIEESRRNK